MTTSSQPQIVRKKLNLSVKKQLQIWLLIRITGIILLCSLAAALVLFFYSRQELNDSLWQAHIKIRRVSDLLFPVLLTGAGVSMLAGFCLALFLPQKIAGPIFRMEQDLKIIRNGDLTKVIHLRNNDIFTELADEINDTIGMFREHAQEIKKLQVHLAQLAVQGKKEELNDALNKLKDLLATLRT